jgi:hypothetical protein
MVALRGHSLIHCKVSNHPHSGWFEVVEALLQLNAPNFQFVECLPFDDLEGE